MAHLSGNVCEFSLQLSRTSAAHQEAQNQTKNAAEFARWIQHLEISLVIWNRVEMREWLLDTKQLSKTRDPQQEGPGL